MHPNKGQASFKNPVGLLSHEHQQTLLRSDPSDWADLIRSGRADEFKESELLPDFLTDFFYCLLDCTGPAGVCSVATDVSWRMLAAPKPASTDLGHEFSGLRPSLGSTTNGSSRINTL
jgi:hypothetical protein